MKKSSFRGKTSTDAHRQKNAASSYGYLKLPKNVSVYSPEPDSRVKLDFMPYIVTDKNHPDRNVQSDIAVEGSLWYKRPFKIHREIGTGNDTVVCPTSFGKRCPICEHRAKRFKEGADPEETKALKASDRNLYLVIPLDSKKNEAKLHLMDISQYLFQNLLNDELEEDEDHGVFPDLEEGLTLKVRWNSSVIGKSKPFAEANRIDFLEREEGYDEKMLDTIPSLDELLTVMSYEALQAKFFELDSEETTKEADEDEEEEEKPIVRKKKTIAPEPEPEEEEEEEEAPAPPVRKKKPAPVVEEDDEDEEDEEEETPTPVRTKKTAVPEPAAKAKPAGNKCPHGHKFGVDVEKYDECDDCKLWDACDDAKG